MCDEVFDRVAAQREHFAPVVRAALAAPRPWTETLLLDQIERTLPGLCWDAAELGATTLTWRQVALRVIALERRRLRAEPARGLRWTPPAAASPSPA